MTGTVYALSVIVHKVILIFNGLVSSRELLCQALSQWVEEACVHMCYLWMLEVGDWHPHLVVVISKPL
jgi:hypothetical protein